MFNHLLTFLALISFSIVSYAAAIPMDADQAVGDATQNAVLHKDVAAMQGGRSDKDVAEVLAVTTLTSCAGDALCDSDHGMVIEPKTSTLNYWFVGQGSSDSPLQTLVVLILIVVLIVFFLSRKSPSTK